MPWVRFEPTIPVFERTKTVHALERAATVIGTACIHLLIPLQGYGKFFFALGNYLHNGEIRQQKRWHLILHGSEIEDVSKSLSRISYVEDKKIFVPFWWEPYCEHCDDVPNKKMTSL
jgi:hypothetical protein